VNADPFGQVSSEDMQRMQAQILQRQRELATQGGAPPPPAGGGLVEGMAPQQQGAPVPNVAAAGLNPFAGGAPPPQPRGMVEGMAPAAPTRNLAPGPSQAGMQPGVQGAPQGDPGVEALQRFLRQGTATPGHAQGLSPADRTYQRSLNDQGMQGMLVDENSMARQRAIAEKQAADSAAANASEQQGLLSFQESQKRDAERQAQFERETRQQQTKITRQIDELQAQGVDPNHYWQNTSTAGKIAAGIAVGLGGFAAGLNPHLGGHNAALEIINGAIERDIDAQKVNLQKSMGLLKSRMELNGQNFDEQAALNRAERDSVLTAYTVASNSLAKQAANNNGNADFQQRSAVLEQGLQKSKMDLVASLAHENYVIGKGAEKLVASPQTAISDKIRALSINLMEKANANSHEMTPDQADRLAARMIIGKDVSPGQPMPSMAKPQKGGAGALGGKTVEQVNALETAKSNIDQLIEMRKNAGIIRGADSKARAEGLSLETRSLLDKGLGGRMSPELLKQFGQMVPEDPLEHNASGLVGQDPTLARLQMTRQSIDKHIAQLRSNPGAQDANDNPAGGKAEEE